MAIEFRLQQGDVLHVSSDLLLLKYARSFYGADVLLVADIYAASEQPIPGITAEVLTENIKKYGHKNATYIGDIDTAAAIVTKELQTDDLVITLGAGSVTRLSEEILQQLNEKSANVEAGI